MQILQSEGRLADGPMPLDGAVATPQLPTGSRQASLRFCLEVQHILEAIFFIHKTLQKHM